MPRDLGLFDTFVVKNAKCEACGHIYDADFQTKAFDPILLTFKQGESVRDLLKEAGFRFKGGDAEFEMHDICPKCDKYFETWGKIKNNRFIGQVSKAERSKDPA